MMRSPVLIVRAARELGIHPLMLLGMHQIRWRTGWLHRRTPIHAWEDRPLRAALQSGVTHEPINYLQFRASKERRFLFDEDEPAVVYEDVPDEDDLPPGWEDLLYESWRDQQKHKQTESRNEIS